MNPEELHKQGLVHHTEVVALRRDEELRMQVLEQERHKFGQREEGKSTQEARTDQSLGERSPCQMEVGHRRFAGRTCWLKKA